MASIMLHQGLGLCVRSDDALVHHNDTSPKSRIKQAISAFFAASARNCCGKAPGWLGMTG